MTAGVVACADLATAAEVDPLAKKRVLGSLP
jgi:hypothetical protein